MKFSICATDRPLENTSPFPLRGDSFEDCARVAGMLGFDGIELQVQNPSRYDVRRLRSVLDDRGLGCSAVTTGLAYLFEGMSMVHPDKKMRMATIERLCRDMDMAKELDSQILIGYMRGRKTAGQTDEEYEDILTEMFFARQKELCGFWKNLIPCGFSTTEILITWPLKIMIFLRQSGYL